MIFQLFVVIILLIKLESIYSTMSNTILTRKLMKAAVVNGYKSPFTIKQVEIPKPKANELLVKIVASGCCHTDLHAIDADWPVKSKMPLTPGHEGAGIVEQVGSQVTKYKVGDRVGIAWLHSACGQCEYCLSGWETLCTLQQNTGYGVDGCLREYAIAQESHAIPLPSAISFEQAAPILCAGVTSYKGLKESETKPGEFMSIIGAGGGLGHLAIQYAKAMGMRPIAVDVGLEKKQLCLDLGAELYVDALATSTNNPTDIINQYTDGGSHGVLCLATNPKAFQLAINSCRRKGCVVCCGLPPGNFDTPIFDIVLKRVTIRGSIVGTRKDMTEALDFANRGLVKCHIETAALDDVDAVYTKMREGKINGRVVINKF